MDLYELWDTARKRTEILRMQLQDLATFEQTLVPYIFLGESSMNSGDTVVRQGSVLIAKPSLILPNFSPQFEGFDMSEALHVSPEALTTFLLVRGLQFPSLKYRHQLSSLDVYEGSLQQGIRHYQDRLTAAEDIRTGMVIGPEEAWQFSVLLLTGALVVRSAEGDLRRIVEAWRKRQSGAPGG